MMTERYFLTMVGEEEKEVTVQEWVKVERSHGFLGSGSDQIPSTWHFKGLDGTHGRRAFEAVKVAND